MACARGYTELNHIGDLRIGFGSGRGCGLSCRRGLCCGSGLLYGWGLSDTCILLC